MAKLFYNFNVVSCFASGILKIVIFISVAFSIITALPRLSPVLYPDVPEPSHIFDCDDGTLYMYQYFQSLGIESTPILGNLYAEGEEFLECNHVWLLVKSGGKNIAYDWGEPRFDKQHYEGYTINLEYLLYAVADDISNNMHASMKTATY